MQTLARNHRTTNVFSTKVRQIFLRKCAMAARTLLLHLWVHPIISFQWKVISLERTNQRKWFWCKNNNNNDRKTQRYYFTKNQGETIMKDPINFNQCDCSECSIAAEICICFRCLFFSSCKRYCSSAWIFHALNQFNKYSRFFFIQINFFLLHFYAALLSHDW